MAMRSARDLSRRIDACGTVCPPVSGGCVDEVALLGSDLYGQDYAVVKKVADNMDALLAMWTTAQGGFDWSHITGKPAIINAIQGLTPTAGKLIEFTGPTSATLVNPDSGPPGAQGPPGATGAQGPQGIQGIQGPQGVPGTGGGTGTGSVDWASITGKPAIITAIMGLAPSAGTIIEFTGSLSAHLLTTPISGGTGGTANLNSASRGTLVVAEDDAAAAIAGVAVGGFYENGSVIQIRRA